VNGREQLYTSLFCVATADAPTITLKPRNHKFREGSTALLVCEARGDPAPVLVWRHCQRNVKREGRAHISQRTAHASSAQRAAGAGAAAAASSSSSASSGGSAAEEEEARTGRGVTTSVLRFEDLTVHESCPVECVAENSASDGVREEATLTVAAGQKKKTISL